MKKKLKNFILFFNGKEGTSALIHLLNNFEEVSIVHQEENRGWEPFDTHSCGLIKPNDIKECLDILFDSDDLVNDWSRLNQIYKKTARAPLDNNILKRNAIGFKMRFYDPRGKYRLFSSFICFYRNYYTMRENLKYNSMMMEVLQKENMVVFMMVRLDVFRWALSKYHGDGTGKKGNLQFKLAKGTMKKEEIPKINVDVNKFKKILEDCKYLINRKKKLYQKLKTKNIQVHPIFYEDFCNDKVSCFQRFFESLGYTMSEKLIIKVLNKGAYFKKVHSNDISDFVINHEEINDLFGHEKMIW